MLSLRDHKRRRKYLTPTERSAFLKAAQSLEGERKALCQLLYYTGCRISEGLALDSDSLDVGESVVVFWTLKQRTEETFREIPIPLSLLHDLNALVRDGQIFTISRATAWRTVKAVMEQAGIEGIHATPKGLRHGFAIAHAAAKTPPDVIQEWMGHTSEETTKIYLKVRGEEALKLAKAVW